MKWLGAILLITMTTWFGFDLSKRLGERKQQIRSFIQSIQMLEAEMTYSALALQQIFENISKRMDHPINLFYERLSNRLKGIVSDFLIVWDEELTWLMKNSSLKASEQEILKQFGRHLGQHTLVQQQKHIKLTLHYLQRQLEEAEDQKKRYETMMKSLGVLIGLFIVILLF